MNCQIRQIDAVERNTAVVASHWRSLELDDSSLPECGNSIQTAIESPLLVVSTKNIAGTLRVCMSSSHERGSYRVRGESTVTLTTPPLKLVWMRERFRHTRERRFMDLDSDSVNGWNCEPNMDTRWAKLGHQERLRQSSLHPVIAMQNLNMIDH